MGHSFSVLDFGAVGDGLTDDSLGFQLAIDAAAAAPGAGKGDFACGATGDGSAVQRTHRYPLAPNGIFLSPQGEGALAGEPMVFVRLAGCSIGCKLCDTNFSVRERLDARAIATRVAELKPFGVRWIWVTGGEPTDHELAPLFAALRNLSPQLRIALATAGHRTVERGMHGPDWLSVSPHDPAKWVQMAGNELKLIPKLNGFRLRDFAPIVFGQTPPAFGVCFVQPCAGEPDTVRECWDWVREHPTWRLGFQAHVQWGMA